MIRNLICSVLLGLGLLGVSSGPLSGQADPAAQATAQSGDSLDLIFEREVFIYPQYERRNPFTPLVSDDESGPRIEEIQLIAVLYSPDNPAASVATFGRRGVQSGEGAGAQTYRVKRGDVLGNIRILDIQMRQVVVEIEEFGMTERRTMELHRPGQGGIS